jgi:hypothetical protein
MKNIYVSHLIDYLAEEVSDEFYLKDIQLCRTTERSIPYLSLTLQDKTGMVYGIIWENNIEEQYLSLKGKIVKVYGEVLMEDNQVKYICWKMEPVTDYDIGSFINGLSMKEVEHYLYVLNKQVNLVKHPAFRELLNLVISGQKHKLIETPASLLYAGNYNGAILVQSVSVTSIAIQIMRSQQLYAYHPDLKVPYNEDLLITASILLGIGLSNLYSPFPEAQKISEYALLTKDTVTFQLIEQYSSKLESFLSVEDKNLLYHLIQSAYRKDNIKPMNREAVILQTAFIAYQKITNLEYHLAENQLKSGAVYVSKLNSYIYLKKDNTKGGKSNDTSGINQCKDNE